MEKKLITFYKMICSVNGSFPFAKLNDFIKEGFNYQKTDINEKKIVIFNFFYNTNGFVKILINDGSPYPCPKKWYDYKTESFTDSKRNGDQVEPKTSYAIIDILNRDIWISNLKKKNILSDFLTEYIDETVDFSEVIDEASFRDSLDRINSVEFTYINDANRGFFRDTDLDEYLSDLGEANSIRIEATFKENSEFSRNNSELKNRIFRKYLENKDSYRSLKIKGKNKDDETLIFNKKIIVKAHTFRLAVSEETGLFDNEEVFNEIIALCKK
ncbi:hypothetical protein IBE33_09055 [Francisella philomiragia]|uniref:hypothetical protein n=1 Tax=Francisella philomiragia TaxID=28110 RepID=UPI0019072015|nr:hypothetical protein [Francisella philomiragia]MBK2341656.1 hypothetical protein [Francisella philomiragia]